MFDTTTVHRIQAGTKADNVAEQRALGAVGFVREGVQRGLYLRAGEWRDSIMYALLRQVSCGSENAVTRQANEVVAWPTWETLLGLFRSEFNIADGAEFDLPLLAQYVASAPGGRERLVQHVVDALDMVTTGPAKPSENHELIVALPLDELWTTNFEPLLELADSSLRPIRTDDDFIAVRVRARHVDGLVRRRG